MAAYPMPHNCCFYSDLKTNTNSNMNIDSSVHDATELHPHLAPSSWVNGAKLLHPADQEYYYYYYYYHYYYSMNNIGEAAALMSFPDTISMPTAAPFNFQPHETASLDDHLQPAVPSHLNSWTGSIKMEETAANNLQVGKYSVEERKNRILRYLKKRNQRNFTKTIKYACRKTLADRRVRVRGRFARNMELSDEDSQMRSLTKEDQYKYYSNSSDDPLLITNSIQMKPQQVLDIDDEDEWLQEAVANLELMYLPPLPDHIHTSSTTSPT